jgi:hypothetical protein
MSDNVKELLRLIEENPDLPVVPMVDAEVVSGDDWGIWMGSIGTAQVDEYIIPPRSHKPVIFKSDGDVYDALETCLSAEEFDAMPDDEENSIAVYNALPWKKAIIVYIETV